MPFGPVRFIHGANLWIDHPLRGTGPLSGDYRETAEEATLTAWEQVLTAAIEEHVDFLLLAGNVFVDVDRSVRTRVALRDGFDRLQREQIRVFVTPGRADPSESWRDIPHLPENVTILFPDDRDSVAVIRDGHVIASVASGGSANKRLSQGESSAAADPATGPDPDRRRGPFTVVVVPSGAPAAEPLNASSCDYVALGGDGSRQTISTATGIAHHPGSTQGLSSAETGPHGCTLVQVDSDRNIDTRFVPTAALRWENPAVSVGDRTTPDELREQIRNVLATLGPKPTEALWLVTWQVTGCGRLFDALDENEALWSEFADSPEQTTEAESPDGQRPVMVHRFRLISQFSAAEPSPDGSAAVDEAASGNRLAEQYTRLLANGPLLSPELFDECLKQVSGLDPVHTQRLRSLLPGLNREAVEAVVGRLGRNWFATAPEEGGRYENG